MNRVAVSSAARRHRGHLFNKPQPFGSSVRLTKCGWRERHRQLLSLSFKGLVPAVSRLSLSHSKDSYPLVPRLFLSLAPAVSPGCSESRRRREKDGSAMKQCLSLCNMSTCHQFRVNGETAGDGIRRGDGRRRETNGETTPTPFPALAQGNPFPFRI